ncbi:hypothetical protein DUNSADRAFT_15998 [Dunaliella salina]|uniref:Uncharacterized protein n=1 Tax=Dunaliella salina TaxID=3046 RepID=A0ABQ7G4I7_DUNSA|nr:hypothetical protein DUNSADRAFT_15998 [Dunaliella salina]|eukprot:KAF5829489.1 hypothetical protein DUNSADRAFT_15998 [Dunaliella salina]
MHVRCIQPSSSYSGSLSAGPTRAHGTKLPREQKLPVCEAARIAAYRHDPEREYDEVMDSAGGGASRQGVLPPPSRFTARSSIVPIQHVPGSSVRNGSPSSNGTLRSGDASANGGPSVDKQLQNGKEAQQDSQNGSHQQAVLAPVPQRPVHDPSPPSSNGSTHSHASTQHASHASSTAQGFTAPDASHTSTPVSKTPPIRSPSAYQTQEPFVDSSSPQRHDALGGDVSKRGNEDSQDMGTLCHVLDELERLVSAPASSHHAFPQGQPRPASPDVHLKVQAQARSNSSKRGSAPSALLRSNTFPPFPQHLQQQKRRQLLYTIVCCHSVSQLQHLMACNEQQLDVRHIVAMAKRLAQLHLAHNTSTQHPPGDAAGMTSPNLARTPSSPTLHSRATGEAGNTGAGSTSSAAEPIAPRNSPPAALAALKPPVPVKTSFQASPSPRSSGSTSMGSTGHGSFMPNAQQTGSTAAAATAPRTSPLQQAEPAALQLWGALLDKMMFLTPLVSVQQAADMLQAMSVVRPIADAVMEVHAARDRARALAIKRRRRQREHELEQQEQQQGGRHGGPAEQGQSQMSVPGRRGGASQAGGEVGAQLVEQQAPLSVSESFSSARLGAAPAAAAGAAAPGDAQPSGDSSSSEAYSSSSSSSSTSQVRQASLTTLPPSLPRTLTSKQRQQLAEGLLLHTQHKLRSASPDVLTQILHAVSKLGVQPPASWLAAYWEASGPRLAQHSIDQLLSVCQALGHLGATPPQHWMLSFFAATRPCLRGLHVVGISKLVHGLARLPMRSGQSWMGELLLACEGQLDELDAPAYALLVHGLGCMGHVPPRGWLDELLESAASLMHDFSPEVCAARCAHLHGPGFHGPCTLSQLAG